MTTYWIAQQGGPDTMRRTKEEALKVGKEWSERKHQGHYIGRVRVQSEQVICYFNAGKREEPPENTNTSAEIWLVEGFYLSDQFSGETFWSGVCFPDYGYGIFSSKAKAKAKVAEWKSNNRSYYGIGLHGNDVVTKIRYTKQAIA